MTKKDTYTSKLFGSISKKTKRVSSSKKKVKKTLHSYIEYLNKSSFLNSYKKMQKEMANYSDSI